jgi:hypothetical protein
LIFGMRYSCIGGCLEWNADLVCRRDTVTRIKQIYTDFF